MEGVSLAMERSQRVKAVRGLKLAEDLRRA